MKSASFVAASALACACALAALPASATPPADSAEAFKHFDRGVKLADEEDWATALVEFERAYELHPDYRVLFNIAQCRYQMHDYPAALSAFQRYLAEGKDSIAADRRSKVEADIEVLRGRVGSLVVSAAAAGDEVLVDDVVVGTTPLTAPIVVRAGRHKVAARRAGITTFSRQVALAGEESLTIAIDSDVSRPLPPSAVVPSSSPAASARPTTVPAWLSFAVGAAGLGLGAYFGVVALDDKSKLDGQCTDKICPPGAQPLVSSSQRAALASTICTAVGAGGLVGGAVYLAVASSGRRRPEGATAALLIGPGWLAGSGSF